LVLLSICGGSALADSWEARLKNGQEFSVDPTTNRVLLESGVGQGRPLWDGVHRLQDGSTITIRSGVMVPNEELETLGEAEPADVAKPDADESSTVVPMTRGNRCNELVLKTCGLKNACAENEACLLSRQLREIQRKPSSQAKDSRGWAEERCREALDDSEQFTSCDREPPLLAASCEQLLEHVCSSTPRCFESNSCVTARDLVDLELSALEQDKTDDLETVRRRCQDMLVDHAFFPPCR
jgi:hypothetical protein